jgi:hypothetical protein
MAQPSDLSPVVHAQHPFVLPARLEPDSAGRGQNQVKPRGQFHASPTHVTLNLLGSARVCCLHFRAGAPPLLGAYVAVPTWNQVLAVKVDEPAVWTCRCGRGGGRRRAGWG